MQKQTEIKEWKYYFTTLQSDGLKRSEDFIAKAYTFYKLPALLLSFIHVKDVRCEVKGMKI